jgi:hypothetical protein
MALTGQGLNVIHCSAQNERGIYSMVLFKEKYQMSLESRDNFECTPLHFAVLNK